MRISNLLLRFTNWVRISLKDVHEHSSESKRTIELSPAHDHISSKQYKSNHKTGQKVPVVKEGIRFGFCAINLCLSLLVHYEDSQRDLLENHLRWPEDKRRILEIPVQALLSSQQRTYSAAFRNHLL